MDKQVFGYARVSTREQNEARQLIALSAFNIPQRNLYIDRQSGKDFVRPDYQKLLKRLVPGDLLPVQTLTD